MLFVVLWGKSSLWALQHFLITSTLRTWKCKNAQAWGESELRMTCMGGVDAGVWFEAGTQLYVENDSYSLNVSLPPQVPLRKLHPLYYPKAK